MAGVPNIRALGDAMLSGSVRQGQIRKAPTQTTTAFWAADLSMAAGNPLPNYYASTPLEAATLNGMKGIFHGDDSGDKTKVLTSLCLCSTSANLTGYFHLLDYLLYYPFVDLDTTDVQTMDNAVTLPRYESGEGVQAVLVAVAPTLGGGSFTYDYVDADGNAQTSPVISCATTAASIASIVTSMPSTFGLGRIFLPQAEGSRGIRSITSLTMVTGHGGLGAIVLVRPLVRVALPSANMPVEKHWPAMDAGSVVIKDDAYLNLMAFVSGNISTSVLAGYADFALVGD